MENRVQLIESRLKSALQPTLLEVFDESHLHIGHEGAKGGAGHYRVRIQSPLFAGKSALQRQRMVYAAVQDLMPHAIHALSIQADVSFLL